MIHLRASLIVPLLLVAATAARADVIVYQQPSDFPVIGAPGVWASQIDQPPPNGIGDFATAYDNFTLTNTTSITGITWQGGYFAAPGEPGPFQGNITSFTISFWPNVGGQPPPFNFSSPTASALMTYQISGTANETFVGLEPASGHAGGNLVYDYSTSLPAPFLAQAGVTYWLSIQANLTDPEWGWHTAFGPPIGPGDGNSYQDFSPDGSQANFGRFTNPDLAFALLTPTPVPEPVSLALWGLFAGGGLLNWYRRRRAAR